MKKTIFIIFLICVLFVFKYLFHDQVCYVETFESQKFLVRNVSDKQEAAEMLYDIRKRLLLLVDTIILEMESGKTKDKISDKYYAYVKTIQKRLPHSVIKESSHNSHYTSYTTNKGEEIVFCLRSKYTGKLHDINNIMYVAIHEIAHVGCPEIGHTELFHIINKFLLNEGIVKGVYKYVNYRKNPVEYCGIKLDNTIIDNSVQI